ncbi:tetratricopeptide repeat protein [Leadbettera azotonutricia]|uniref:Tetratricopeptide repeat domain protein n=1 Tax=Leadbettera azotonutricia (strain ATCC BAA-888 / DSM 13862 / ZAS-9) TaxID=545695 RepID=F5Y9P3_LEAAZ|nr:tetratricopeptide repeat protein [Leadbettera azotonutricia]AEF80440.1 tetratricopeptide repeat domain protein [Leadbettera azotonutricia ZAS-9]
MTKSRIWNMFTIVLFVIILTGCAKEVKILPPLDKKMAEEECAVLIIPADAKVMRINGEKRGLFSSWGVGFWSSGLLGSKAVTLLVPPGKYTILFKYSHPLDGWSVKNLECIEDMVAGKMYMISVSLDEKAEHGTTFSAINVATSFVRDQIVDLIPLIEHIPRPNPKGVVYHINEIDQVAFNQYLLEENIYRKNATGILLLGLLVGVLWFFIISFGLRLLGYFLFMGKFESSHTVASFMLAIGMVVAGIFIVNYNSSGTFSLYLLSTFLIGIGISRWNAGADSNKSGIEKQKKEDWYGAVSNFTEAIKVAPYTAIYIYNRGISYTHLQEWGKAIADLTYAAKLSPNNNKIKKDLEQVQDLVAQKG